jgi:hypothetical protein
LRLVELGRECVKRERGGVSCNDMSFAEVNLFFGEQLIQNTEDVRLAQMINSNVGVYIWVKSPY